MYIDGDLTWNAPVDIALDAMSISDLVAVESDSGVCFARSDYERDRGEGTNRQQWGQRIGIDGERLWGDRGLAIQANIPLHHSATTDCNGGVITVRDFAYPNVQMMNRNGEIGAVLPVSVRDDCDQQRSPELSWQPLIYPNPCNSHFRIMFDDRINKETFRYSIYNMMGRSVTDGIMIGAPYWIEDLSRFPSGEYILQIQSSRTISTKRFSLVK